jgi:sulfoxide reductase heme-binding subunit YedZ
MSQRSARRARHWLVLLATVPVAVGVAWPALGPHPHGRAVWSVALAYLALLAALATLTIGPVKVLRRRPNPLSTDLRRDIGLFAAACALAHVVLAFGDHFGGVVHRYFFTDPTTSFASLRRDRFAVGLWLGVAATLLVVLLALVSNDVSVRRLGTRRWKRLQRTNYAYAVLALAHAVVFAELLGRIEIGVVACLGAVTVLALQLGAMATVRRRVATIPR